MMSKKTKTSVISCFISGIVFIATALAINITGELPDWLPQILDVSAIIASAFGIKLVLPNYKGIEEDGRPATETTEDRQNAKSKENSAESGSIS